MNRYEIDYLDENRELELAKVTGEAIEEVLMAFITANRHRDIQVIGINKLGETK